jgi:hypothetical protein
LFLKKQRTLQKFFLKPLIFSKTIKKKLSIGILCLTLCFALSCSRQTDLQPKANKTISKKQNKSTSNANALASLTEAQTKWIFERLSPESKAQAWRNRLQRKAQQIVNVGQISFIERVLATISPNIFADYQSSRAIINNFETEALVYFSHQERRDVFGNLRFHEDLDTEEVQVLARRGFATSFFTNKEPKCGCRWGTYGCECKNGGCEVSGPGCGFFWWQDCTGLCNDPTPGGGF